MAERTQLSSRDSDSPPEVKRREARPDTGGSLATRLLALQRSAGNAAVTQLIRPRGGGSALVQRTFAPASIKPNTRQPAVDYLWNNTQRIVDGYLKAHRPGDNIKAVDIERVFATTCEEVAQRFGQEGNFKAALDELAAEVFDQNSALRATLVGAANAPTHISVLQLGVRALNALEHDVGLMQATDPSVNPRGRVNVGTEFTFTNASLNTLKVPTNVGVGKAVIDDWKARIETPDGPPATGAAKPSIEKIDGKVGDQAAWKFTYTQGQQQWWWALDVDDKCIETQTAPTPTDRLLGGWVSGIMNNDIFGLATQKLGLIVDSSAFGGGGHISLDSATLFGGSVELLLEVLTKIQGDCTTWKQQFNYIDEPNSPWLGEQGFKGNPTLKGAALTAFQAKITEITDKLTKGTVVSFDAVTSELEAFHRDVVNLWATANQSSSTREYKDAADNILIPKNRPHYQAVNVEHLVPAKGAGRRLELRAIGAQPNVEGLKRDLDYILALVQKAMDAARSNAADRAATRGVWG